jgi:hypothetical protein
MASVLQDPILNKGVTENSRGSVPELCLVLGEGALDVSDDAELPLAA